MKVATKVVTAVMGLAGVLAIVSAYLLTTARGPALQARIYVEDPAIRLVGLKSCPNQAFVDVEDSADYTLDLIGSQGRDGSVCWRERTVLN